MKKEEVRLEIEAALEKFKEAGGLIEILPTENNEKVFNYETVRVSILYGKVRALNLDTGIENLKELRHFFMPNAF